MNFLLGLVGIFFTLLLAPLFILTGVLGCGAFSYRRGRIPKMERQTRFLVFIPAHNEAENIAATVQSLQQANYPAELVDIIVIADNCTDRTGQMARDAGARTWERRDEKRRSKGFALEDAMGQFLPNTVADAVVIIDADTRVDPNLFHAFADELALGHEWIQGYYNASNPDVSWRTRLLTYALSLINGSWLMGLDTCHLGVQLRGNGMCFSINGLRKMPWNASGLAEDIEFGWRLRLAGELVWFTPHARVYGEMVSQGGAGAANQRQRWEHGRKQLRRQFTREILAADVPKLRKFFWLCDLYMMPLAKLITLYAVAVLGVFFAPIHSALLNTLQVSFFVCLVLYLLSPFFMLQIPWRYLLSLSHLPRYMLWKLRLLFNRGPVGWIRTRRENESPRGET